MDKGTIIIGLVLIAVAFFIGYYFAPSGSEEVSVLQQENADLKQQLEEVTQEVGYDEYCLPDSENCNKECEVDEDCVFASCMHGVLNKNQKVAYETCSGEGLPVCMVASPKCVEGVCGAE